uniref:Uroporphyrinogen decarboxylase (URO-D) domain-containing protein n=1 Tax=Candidatus Caldatribacterium californiense TaxID=1454726 RepID=A0A7V4DG22_9BACT
MRKSGYAVVGNLGWTEVFGMAWYLRGFENFMIDLIARKEFAHALLRRITDYQKARYLKFLEIVGNVIDVILFADDLGGQHGLFISPSTYREMIKPCHAEIIQSVRSKTRARIMFHSCGSVTPLLDDFVELGVDILNPVQVSAKRMDTLALKKRYGKRLSFWGAVDTQRILPHGIPEEVRKEVRLRISHLAPGGGYVVAPVHVVQADVPPGNVIAMCQAAKESGKE